MDKLTLRGIQLSTCIGTHAWEQQCPQTLYLDVSFTTCAKTIAKTDKLENAIDYEKMVNHILQFTANTHFQLIETFAERLCQELITDFSLTWIQLCLHKPNAIANATDVNLTLERSST